MPDPSSLPKLVSNSPADEIQSASKVTPASALTLGSAPALAPKFLPLAWILDPDKNRSITDRILARIVQAESKERNAHFRDDYRQAFICISLAAKGEDIPFIQSSYKMYGLHPDKLWPRIVARRKADLGKLYSQFYDENDLLIKESDSGTVSTRLGQQGTPRNSSRDSILPSPASPKKPPQSVGRKSEEEIA